MTKTFGEKLREARLAKGLTTSQVASRTHILVKIIESLEAEDFRKIPAPIYGRGFVRIYCDCVGIDSKPLIAEYMEIHSGKKTPLYIRQKTKASGVSPYVDGEDVFAASPAYGDDSGLQPQDVAVPAEEESLSAPAAEPAAEETADPAVSGLELFERPEKVNPFEVSETPAVSGTPFESSPYESPFVETEKKPYRKTPEGPSVAERFKNGISVFSKDIIKNVHNMPRRTWRIFALSGAIVLMVAFVVWSVSKLYQVTSSPAAPQTTAAARTSAPDGTPTNAGESIPPKARGKLKSSGYPTGPLYVD